jgi:hypothetical protein
MGAGRVGGRPRAARKRPRAGELGREDPSRSPSRRPPLPAPPTGSGASAGAVSRPAARCTPPSAPPPPPPQAGAARPQAAWVGARGRAQLPPARCRGRFVGVRAARQACIAGHPRGPPTTPLHAACGPCGLQARDPQATQSRAPLPPPLQSPAASCPGHHACRAHCSTSKWSRAAARRHMASSQGQPCWRAHCSISRRPCAAAALHVLSSQGQPCWRAHCSTARWPPDTASLHVLSSHGQPCWRAHCSTSRWPPYAASWHVSWSQ